jgi:lysophospholipase L1-like esterase
MSICVFGDSIAWGAFDPVNGGWVTLLRNHVEHEWERLNDKSVYNLAINGETTSSLLLRFEVEFSAREPEIVIFALGINDSCFWNIGGKQLVPIEGFKANLSKLTELAKKYTNQIVFVGLTPIDEQVTHPFDNENTFVAVETQKHNHAIKEHCLEHQLVFIDLSSHLTLADIDDGVHPNTVGHQKIFNAVKPIVEKLLV